LAKPDDDNIVKNFGMTRWNEREFENDEDLEADNAVRLFDGDADDDKRLMKIEMMESL